MRGRRITVLAVAAVIAVASGLWWWRDRQSGERRIDADSIVMLGDSITAGGDWATLLPGVPIVNEGHPGFTTDQLATRIGDIGDAAPAAVLVMTGTNDVRDGLPPATTVAGLTRLLDELESRAPGTVVIVQSILPRRAKASQIVETNLALRTFAAGRGVQYVDLHAAFDDGEGGLRPDETTDDWHLSELGYRRWATIIGPIVDGLADDRR